MLYPLFFTPVYKNIIWGGRNLERIFNRALPEGNIAESWDICCHKNGMSIVSNGSLSGEKLSDLILKYGTNLMGSNCNDMDRFPILIKIIDANDKLSVQVHPGNEYALTAHGELGKTEMWYVIHAKPNSKLIYSVLPGTTKDTFRTAIENGTLEKHLNYVDVKADDVIYIPSGTVHAIMDGLVIAEIQQNSDTTYRVYDWNRVDKDGAARELHVARALDVINFDFTGRITVQILEPQSGYSITRIVDCDFFKVDKIMVEEVYLDKTNPESFYAYTCVNGNGYIEHENMKFDIVAGSSFMLPAMMGAYKICGKLTLLKSYI